jgi:hypothetical protein
MSHIEPLRGCLKLFEELNKHNFEDSVYSFKENPATRGLSRQYISTRRCIRKRGSLARWKRLGGVGIHAYLLESHYARSKVEKEGGDHRTQYHISSRQAFLLRVYPPPTTIDTNTLTSLLNRTLHRHSWRHQHPFQGSFLPSRRTRPTRASSSL